MYFLKRKSDVEDALRNFLADAGADGVPSKVAIEISDDRGEFFCGELVEVCKPFCIKQKQNGAVERALVM